jgi:hypothetical protein
MRITEFAVVTMSSRATRPAPERRHQSRMFIEEPAERFRGGLPSRRFGLSQYESELITSPMLRVESFCQTPNTAVEDHVKE